MYSAWATVRRRFLLGDLSPSSGDATTAASGSPAAAGLAGSPVAQSPAPARPAEWLPPLLHHASLGHRLREALSWADLTGCIERDLLEDDEAAHEVSRSLRLRKFEDKRWRRAVAERRAALGIPESPTASGAAAAAANRKPGSLVSRHLIGSMLLVFVVGVALIFLVVPSVEYVKDAGRHTLDILCQFCLRAAGALSVVFPWSWRWAAAVGELAHESSLSLVSVLGDMADSVKERLVQSSFMEIDISTDLTLLHVTLFLLLSAPFVLAIHLWNDFTEIRSTSTHMVFGSYFFAIVVVIAAHVLLHYLYHNGFDQATQVAFNFLRQVSDTVQAFALFVAQAAGKLMSAGFGFFLTLLLAVFYRKSSLCRDLWKRGSSSRSTACIICMGAAAEATFVHRGTGHTCTCMSCAQMVMRRGDACPMCRLPIDSVIHNYT